MLTRAQKAENISAISDRLGKATATFVVDFKGMDVEEVTGFRKSLAASNCEMRVVKNTLAKLALKDHPKSEEAIGEVFVGTNAMVFAYEDAAATAKALAESEKTIEALQLKIGVFEGERLDESKIKYLATLPSKDELRAKLLNVFMAPATSTVRVMNAIPSGFLNVMNAYKETKE